MNRHRVASLLRELADAIEQEDGSKRPRKLPVTGVKSNPSEEAKDRVRRNLRKNGLVA